MGRRRPSAAHPSNGRGKLGSFLDRRRPTHVNVVGQVVDVHTPGALLRAALDAEPSAMPPPTFIPLALPARAVDGEIHIELQRSDTTIKVVWPAGAARECAAWLRDWLR